MIGPQPKSYSLSFWTPLSSIAIESRSGKPHSEDVVISVIIRNGRCTIITVSGSYPETYWFRLRHLLRPLRVCVDFRLHDVINPRESSHQFDVLFLKL